MTGKIDALLRRYDEGGGSVLLDAAAEQYPPNASLINHLLNKAEATEPKIQLACLALLKRYQQAGISFPARATKRLLELLPTLPDWKAQLQILQMLPELEVSDEVTDSLCETLHLMLRRRNRFIRAWAYGGLHRVAFLHREYRPEVRALLKEAASHEAASIRARLRQLDPL